MAFHTIIVRAQGIYLRNSRHICHQRRAHRASGTHQITVLHRLPHQLLGDDVHHGEAVCDDGMQLLLQPLLHDGGEIFPVQGMGLAVADIGQRLVAVRNHGRALIRPHRRNGLDLIRDQVGIGDHHLFGLIASQILKFLQHLLRGAQVQRGLILGILKALSCHDDPAVHLVRRIQKMHVTGCHHRLAILLSQLHDSAVDILDVLDGIHQTDFFIIDHEGVVSRGLNLQIIVKIHDPRDIRLAFFIQQGAVQLTCFTGASQDQPLPAL